MKQLYIIRGIPGSGKSTLAHKLMAAHLLDGTAIHCEADQYFVNRRGEYLYDRTKVQDAHWFCVNKVEKAMEEKTPTIITSNTFTQEWQIEPYRLLAATFEYTVQEIVCLGKFESVHGVSQETIKKMRDRLIGDLAKRLITN